MNLNQPDPENDPALGQPLPDENIPRVIPIPVVRPLAPHEPHQPPRPPHPAFWWSVLWCLGFLMVTQLMVPIGAIVGIIAFMAVQAGDMRTALASIQPKSPAFAEVMKSTFLITEIGVILFSLLVIRLMVGKEWPRKLGLVFPKPLHLLLVLLLVPAVLTVGDGVYHLAKPIYQDIVSQVEAWAEARGFELPSIGGLEEMMKIVAAWDWRFAVLVIAVGAGIGEELWCRGFLGRGLVGHYGPVAGALLTSFLFGAIHIYPLQAVAAAAIGLVLHYVYLTTRCLWLPMLLHFSNNAIAVMAGSDQPPIRALKALDRDDPSPWYVYLSAALLLLAVGWVLFKSRARVRKVPAENWPPPYPGVEHPLYRQEQEEGRPEGWPHRKESGSQEDWPPLFPGVEHPPQGQGLEYPWPGLAAVGVALLTFAGVGAAYYFAYFW